MMFDFAKMLADLINQSQTPAWINRSRRGRRGKQDHNSNSRGNGIEPRPGLYAGVKRRARYLKRA